MLQISSGITTVITPSEVAAYDDLYLLGYGIE